MKAIKELAVRASSKEELDTTFHDICDKLAMSRPTARNLFWAIERMKRYFHESIEYSVKDIKSHLVREAINICEKDTR